MMRAHVDAVQVRALVFEWDTRVAFTAASTSGEK